MNDSSAALLGIDENWTDMKSPNASDVAPLALARHNYKAGAQLSHHRIDCRTMTQIEHIDPLQQSARFYRAGPVNWCHRWNRLIPLGEEQFRLALTEYMVLPFARNDPGQLVPRETTGNRTAKDNAATTAFCKLRRSHLAFRRQHSSRGQYLRVTHTRCDA
jgi:hypothetical protein